MTAPTHHDLANRLRAQADTDAHKRLQTLLGREAGK